METVRSRLPGIGQQLKPETFHGSGVALVIGILGTLYGALGAMQAAQASFNQIYGVPRNEQPNPIKSRIRSLGLLGLLGSGILLSTGIAAVLATANGLSKHLVRRSTSAATSSTTSWTSRSSAPHFGS